MQRFTVSKVLLGLRRVGIVGLTEAIGEVDALGLADRDAIVDRLMQILARRNHIPDGADHAYRQAVLREYLRHKGEPIHDCFARVDVTVRGTPGKERDAFVALLVSVFAEDELEPAVTLSEGSADDDPALVIDGEVVARGPQSRESLREAVQRTISDW